MALDHSPEGCKESLAQRAPTPTRDVESLAVEQIVLECLPQLRAEIRADNEKVHFVIQTERAMVNVGGPHERPATIHDEHFRVHHVGGVLVDVDACFQKTAVPASPGSPDETMIGIRSSSQNANVHAASDCRDKFPPNPAIGDEIGCAEIDAFSRRREKNLDQYSRSRRAPARRSASDRDARGVLSGSVIFNHDRKRIWPDQ